jgi:hypothetical protein
VPSPSPACGGRSGWGDATGQAPVTPGPHPALSRKRDLCRIRGRSKKSSLPAGERVRERGRAERVLSNGVSAPKPPSAAPPLPSPLPAGERGFYKGLASGGGVMKTSTRDSMSACNEQEEYRRSFPPLGWPRPGRPPCRRRPQDLVGHLLNTGGKQEPTPHLVVGFAERAAYRFTFQRARRQSRRLCQYMSVSEDIPEQTGDARSRSLPA